MVQIMVQIITLIYSIFIVFNAKVTLLVSQSTYCYNAYSCVGQTIVKTNGFNSDIRGYGYRCLEGATTSINVSDQSFDHPLPSAECGGAFSCNQINYILQANNIECLSSNACSEINGTNYLRLISSDAEISCDGSNSCKYSYLTSTSPSNDYNTVRCNGDKSCQYATLIGIRSVQVYGAYGFYGATYNSIGIQYNPSIELHAYHAGFGAHYICNSAHTCTIDCYGNACAMLFIECQGNDNCIVNTQSSNTILPIRSSDSFDTSVLHALYDSEVLTLATEQSCNSPSATTFDDHQSGYNRNNINITSGTEAPLCCRASQACLSVGHIHVNTNSKEDSIVCSGVESCKNSKITNNQGPIFCEADRSCSSADIVTSNNVYCFSSGCSGGSISANNIF